MNTEFYEKIVKQDDFKSLSIMLGVSATDSDFISLKALLDRVEFNDEFSSINYQINEGDTA